MFEGGTWKQPSLVMDSRAATNEVVAVEYLKDATHASDMLMQIPVSMFERRGSLGRHLYRNFVKSKCKKFKAWLFSFTPSSLSYSVISSKVEL